MRYMAFEIGLCLCYSMNNKASQRGESDKKNSSQGGGPNFLAPPTWPLAISWQSLTHGEYISQVLFMVCSVS